MPLATTPTRVSAVREELRGARPPRWDHRPSPRRSLVRAQDWTRRATPDTSSMYTYAQCLREKPVGSDFTSAACLKCGSTAAIDSSSPPLLALRTAWATADSDSGRWVARRSRDRRSSSVAAASSVASVRPGLDVCARRSSKPSAPGTSPLSSVRADASSWSSDHSARMDRARSCATCAVDVSCGPPSALAAGASTAWGVLLPASPMAPASARAVVASAPPSTPPFRKNAMRAERREVDRPKPACAARTSGTAVSCATSTVTGAADSSSNTTDAVRRPCSYPTSVPTCSSPVSLDRSASLAARAAAVPPPTDTTTRQPRRSGSLKPPSTLMAARARHRDAGSMVAADAVWLPSPSSGRAAATAAKSSSAAFATTARTVDAHEAVG